MNDIAPPPQFAPDTDALARQETAPAGTTIVVSQVKSDRVVYFTDDLDYQPPMDGDWYYVSAYQGPLPKGMTLRNCWGWRFRGGVFRDAREAPKLSAAETLLENNRRALLRLLCEKIDAVRAPFLPACISGEAARAVKLAEAQDYLADATRQASYPLLQGLAVARNISLLQAARLVVAKAEETSAVLVESERFREQISQAIVHARDEKTLWDLREWLLDKIYPELTQQFKYRIENIEPPNHAAPLADTHRLHEITRLKVQLREAINAKRKPLQSDYLGNDDIRRHKTMLAQNLLENGGSKREGIDYSALKAYAEARAMPLPEAAQLLLNSLATGRELLAQTERIKDQMLARIEGVKTLQDIRDAEKMLEELRA